MKLATTATAAISAEPKPITAELYRRFVNYCDVAPCTLRSYEIALRSMFDYFREREITRPDTADIIAFKQHLAATGHKPATISVYLVAVRLFFQWTANRWIYPNIADRVRERVERTNKRDNLTADQVRRVLSSIDTTTDKGKRDFALIALMTSAGLRDIEVARATVEDLRTVGGDTVLYVQGKGKKEKSAPVVIVPAVDQAIRVYLATRGNVGGGDPLFASISNHGSGDALTTRSISRIVKTQLAAAGMNSPRLTAHSLRHTAVTLALAAGQGERKVQRFARHAELATTMIYAHDLNDMDARRACASAVADQIFSGVAI